MTKEVNFDAGAEKAHTHHAEYMPDQGTEQPLDGHSLGPRSTHDTEKTGTGYASSVLGENHKAEHSKAVRKVLFKLDILIIPLALLLYLSAYLDRGNLGNAKLQGLYTEVLKSNADSYALALTCFYIPYIILAIPGTLLAKQFNPSRTIACGALIWAIAATCQAAVTTPAGLYVCRAFVGVGEAMFGQAITLYFTMFFSPPDLSKRVSIFIGAGAAAGAFGGLIAYGVSSISNAKIDKWRILFLIEGVPSLVLAVVVFFCLPSRPQNTKYLDEAERTILLTRLNGFSVATEESGIDWRGVKRAFLDWKTYVIAVAYSCMNLTLGSVSGFLPTIIKGLGYTDADAQLWTVPPYAVALVFMVALSTFSDHYRTRGIPVASVYLIGIVGWSILLGVTPVKPTASMLHARYFGCICIVTAGYAAIPLIMSWQSNNTGSQSQRAVSLGMLNCIGQCLAVLASYSFPTAQGPKFTKGITLNLAFQALGFVIALSMTLYYRWENKRRDHVEGGRPPAGTLLNVVEDYDLAAGFRYTP